MGLLLNGRPNPTRPAASCRVYVLVFVFDLFTEEFSVPYDNPHIPKLGIVGFISVITVDSTK